MRQISILLITFLTISCGGIKPTVVTEKRIVKDSIITTTTYVPVKDTIIIKRDTVRLEVPIYKLSETPIIAKSLSGRITASIRKVDEKVQVDCFTERYEQIIETQHKIIEKLMVHLDKTEQIQTKTEYKTPWYSKILSYIGIAFICIVALLIVAKFLKPT